ncbi:LIM domain-containing protein isoform X1 [Alosa alosa]|uniref:LIM domain-containing protein isoform X1 n=2 Tax=Alosa alosa TaxID=278164 RepID=UPI002015471B|nr:LIM domain-containing protein isoform X1 [Alosa alosa]
MEVKSILRRTQSLRSVHTERTLSVTEVGLRDRKKSVSELVAEYRFTSKGKAPISEHEKQENTPAFVPPVLAPAPVPEPTVDPEVESPVAKVRNSIVRERSRSLSERQPQPLSRAKSMESLPRGTGAPGGTSALKALFESKVMTPRELKHGGKSPLNSLRVSRDAQVKAEAEEVVEKVNEVKKNNSHDPPPLMSQAEEATPKVVRRSRPERRQTVSGVYLDRTSQTSDDKEKRRSLADFGWEKSSISVKAISALFQSKAAAVETSGNQGMDSFSPSGKRPKGIKMTEDSQASKSDLSETHLTDDPLQFAAKRPQAHSANMTQNPMRPCLSPTPPSKEAFSALYQQRQKCELKRLLKHTCPELKSLDGVVDEELADVLRSESTAEDTGYQGEVLSRRWIFENCAFENVGDPNDSKTHLEGEGWVTWEEQKRAPPRVVQSMARPMSSGTTLSPVECPLNQSQSHPLLASEIISRDQTDSNVEEEKMADVRSTRMMFESQKIPKHMDSLENASTMKVVVSQDEKGAVKKQMKVFTSNNQKDFNKTKTVMEKQITDHVADSSADAQQDGTDVYMGISKVKDVFERKSSGQTVSRVMGKENTGFVFGKYLENTYLKEGGKRQSGDISLQNSLATLENISAQEEIQKANVKDRAHLFESTPFHKINCRDGVDITDVSMNERLKSLYNFSVIHSNGIIVESFEPGTAKKATYNFTTGHCPQIQTEEIITGNIKNILLQILPRANLTACVNFIKEDEQGNVEIKNIDVPIHQLPFTAHQDREYRTVNLVQVIEDLLNIDNSLKKGVIIQEASHEGTQVSVYSLFSHEELEIKGFFPLQETTEEQMEISSLEEADEEVKGDVKGTIKSLLANAQDKMGPGPRKVEESERGNVELFRKCIEKGDLEYLKSLQKTPSEEELNSAEEAKSPIMEDNATESISGNVKNIKNIFSCQGDVPNPKTRTFHKGNNSVSNTTITSPPDETTNKKTTDEDSYSMQCVKIPDVSLQDSSVIKASRPTTQDEIQDEGKILQAELMVEAVEDDLSNLQAAILSLQQATMEAKTLQHSIQEKQEARVKQEKTHITDRDSFIDQEGILPSESQQLDNSIPVSQTSIPVQDKHTSSSDSEMVGITVEKKGMPQESKSLEHQTEGQWETCETTEDSNVMVIKKGHLQETISFLQSSASELPHEEEKEEIVKGNIKAALKSLGQSSLNVTQGDFRAAMIYKKAGKSYEQRKKTVNTESAVKKSDELVTSSDDSNAIPTASAPVDEQVAIIASNEASAAVAHSTQCKMEPPECINDKGQNTATSKKSKRKGKKNPGPKPAIPPKPDHLKAKPAADKESMLLSSQSIGQHEERKEVPETLKELETEKKLLPQSGPPQSPQSGPPQSGPMSYKDALCKGMMKCPDGRDTAHHESTGTPQTLPCDTTEIKTSDSLERDEVVKQADLEKRKEVNVISNNPEEETVSQQETQTANSSHKGLQGSSAASQVINEFVSGFQAELHTFGPSDQNVNKTKPVKPKRMKMAKDNIVDPTQLSTPQQCNSTISACCVESYPATNDGQKSEECKVVMREKKVKKESEEERIQRLSVHRDEIMRGNVTTAMEIFDNLRKQEELKILLSKVEEIEEDTNQVDVKAMRRIFENVPDWVRITPKKLKPKQAKTAAKCKSPTKGPEISSMELAFGDLEKASAEILNLKEQTLAKLMDIEEAIRKALLSVSTLKSESDIAGLSGLFKESMVSAPVSQSCSNIRTISIGSSKSQKALRQKKQAAHVNQISSSPGTTEVRQTPKLEIPAAKHRAGSPSSPFLSQYSPV